MCFIFFSPLTKQSLILTVLLSTGVNVYFDTRKRAPVPHQPAPAHAPVLTSGPIPDKPFPCRYYPDNSVPLHDGLLLEIRENDPLVQAMHGHGQGEPGKFALPVLPGEFIADLDSTGDRPPLFRDEVALFGIFEKKDGLVPAQQLDEDKVLKEPALVIRKTECNRIAQAGVDTVEFLLVDVLFLQRKIVPEDLEDEVGFFQEPDIIPDRCNTFEPERVAERIVGCRVRHIGDEVLGELPEPLHLADPEPADDVPKEDVIIDPLEVLRVTGFQVIGEPAPRKVPVEPHKNLGLLLCRDPVGPD